MREKIAEWLSMSEKYGNFLVWDSLPNDTQENYRTRAARLINLLSEEIEKVESSHRRLDNGYYVGFKECQEKILALLKE